MERTSSWQDSVEETEESTQEVNPSGKIYRPRTTPVQQDIFLSFAEKYPCVLDKLDPQYKGKWKELAAELNMKGPSRNPINWQDTMKNWEYQITHKFKHQGKKGSPTAREKRALVIFGKIRNTGFEGTRLGQGLPGVPNTQCGGSNDDPDASIRPGQIGESTSQATASFQELVVQDISGREAPSHAPRKKPRLGNGERMDKVIELLEEQQKREADRLKLDEERLKIDQQNAQTWKDFAEAAKALTGALTNFSRN